MKVRLGLPVVAGVLLATFVGAHAQGPNNARRGSGVFGERSLRHRPMVRATDGAADGRGHLAYVIAGITLQFGALDLSSGTFFPIGSGLPPDVGAGLVRGVGTSLLT